MPSDKDAAQDQNESGGLGTKLVKWVLSLPRIVRILIAAIFALAVIVVIRPVVDNIYLRVFQEDPFGLPALITAAWGLVMYMVGYILLVGTIGTERKTKPALIWYLILGTLAVVLAVIWVVWLNISLSF